MRKLAIPTTSRFLILVLVAMILGDFLHVQAQSDIHPLAPPDLSSPRATLQSFLAVMDNAYQVSKSEGRTYKNRGQRATIARTTERFFDLSDIAPAVRYNVGREAAVYMKEVLDRIELPPWEMIPDEAMIATKSGGLNKWTIPHTEITLVRIKDGLHEGEWVFNPETDERVAEFYAQVKHLPYKVGASEGLHELFVSEPGWMIPNSWVSALPWWMKARHRGQAVWQWCGLFLTLVFTAALLLFAFRVMGRLSHSHHGLGYYLAVVVPIFAIIIPQAATDFLSDQLFISGKLFANLDFALDLVSLAGFVALILGVTNRLATGLMTLPWFKPRQLNAHLAQLIVRAVGLTGALIAVFEGGRYLGIPLTTLVAGVSVSGLTVALAAQDTLKNLFGSLMILLDRPFQMGDMIRIKGHQGTVESVGLRSTRIRDASGHIVSISNEEVARLDSENVSRQSHLRRQEILCLPFETPTEKLRRFVASVRGILENHEGRDPKLPPTVELGFAEAAVTVTVTYWYSPPDSAAFASFNENITLQILEEMLKEGIHLSCAGLSSAKNNLFPHSEDRESAEAGVTRQS